MRFKYHMHGEDIGSLSIYRRGFLVWKEIGNHGNRWLEGQVDFDCSMSQYQVSSRLNYYMFTYIRCWLMTKGQMWHKLWNIITVIRNWKIVSHSYRLK